MEASTQFISAVILIAIILVSLSVHEFAHAWVANLFGDPTARIDGRMSINPIRHWDSVGTTLLVVLIFLSAFGVPVPVFGWGKPVPVDERNFENPKWHGLQTALAGPMSNLLLAILLAFIIRLFSPSGIVEETLVLAIYLNAFLMFFNLLPIPPLDGSRILRLFLPDRIYFSLVSNPLMFYLLFFIVIYAFVDPLAFYSRALTNFLIFR